MMNPHANHVLANATWTRELLVRANEAGSRMPSVVRGMQLPPAPEPPVAAFPAPLVLRTTFQEYYAS